MNVLKEKVIGIIFIVIIALLLILSVFQYGRYRELNRNYDSLRLEYTECTESLDRCMDELRLARERNAQYADTFERARATNSELGEFLSRSANTISTLRSILSGIEQRYNEMEAILNNIDLGECSIVDNDSNIYNNIDE